MEWIISIFLLIIGFACLVLESLAGFLFIIPAILFNPIVLDFLDEKGLFISNTLKWIGIFLFSIIGTIIVATQKIDEAKNIEVINPMDGLVLNQTDIMTMDNGLNNQNGNNTGINTDNMNNDLNNNLNNKTEINNPQPEIYKEVEYKIEYYYDGLKIDSATETIIGKEGELIKEYKEKTLNIYDLEKTENYPLKLDSNKTDLTIRIYYTKKATAVTYTVRYYYDGILDSSKTKYLEGMTGEIIKDYPNEKKEGYIPIKTKNFPLKLSENPEQNEMRIYYGFAENTVMDKVGLIDGFAPAILIKEVNNQTNEIIEQYECPYCGSIYNKELLAPVSENTYQCPFCSREVLFNEDGSMTNDEGENIEEVIDNPEQQKISEKYALDTIKHEIHNPLCYYTRKIPSENFRGSNENIKDLITKGYKICKKCNPK